MKRRQWFSLHSWAGMQFAVFLCFVLITGTFATIARDIDWLANPAMRAANSVPVTEVAWPEILRQARAARPAATPISLTVSPDSWFNAETLALDPQGRRFRLFHDRASGAVTGTGRWYNWQRFFRQMHRHLMMPVQVGATFVCLMVVPLLVSLVSSLYVYRHWYRHFFRLPQLAVPSHAGRRRPPSQNRKRRQLWGELHKFAGIWSLWFVMLMVLTSVWYLAELWGLDADYPAEVPAGYSVDMAPELTPARLAELIASARASYPGLRIHSILLPTDSRPWLTLRGQAGAMLVRNRANQVTMDIDSGAVLSLRRGSELGPHLRISEAADPLHFGTLGNGPTRWLWFFFGLLLSGLAISGVYLRAMRAIAAQRESGATLSYWRTGLHGMGWAWWPSFGLVAIGTGLFLVTFIPGY